MLRLTKPKTIIPNAANIPPDWDLIGRNIIELIASSQYLPEPSDFCHLAQASRFFYHATKNIAPKRLDEALAHFVLVQPTLVNLKKLLAVMESDPAWLSHKISHATDHVGYVYRKPYTLFQLACLAGDVEISREIKSVFIKHLGSENEAATALLHQRDELFGHVDEFDATQENDMNRLFSLLDEIIPVIEIQSLDKHQDDKILLSPLTLQCIEKFRTDLDSIMMNSYLGAYGRCRIFSAIYQVYSQIAHDWHYDIFKCLLFEDSVLATLLAYLPANDVYHFSMGLNRYHVDAHFQRVNAYMPGFDQSLTEIVRSESINFVMSGAYFDFMSGSKSDTPDSLESGAAITQKCQAIQDYVDYKQEEFESLLCITPSLHNQP